MTFSGVLVVPISEELNMTVISNDSKEPGSPTLDSWRPNGNEGGTSANEAVGSREAVDKLKVSASETLDHLQGAASAITGEAKDYAGSIASDAAGAFKDAVESNKTAGAGAIASIAHSVKEAADGLENQSPQVAGMVRSAAEGVEKISTDIRDRSVGDLLNSVTAFAQRQPATFFGVGILAGIVLTRVMRSSDR
jgi:hypothetical protein